MSGLGGQLAGVFSIASVGFAAKQALAYASNMADAATATRTGVEEYQVLAFAAREAGASQAQLDKALVNSAISGEKAAQGSKELSAAFGRLGIDIKTFNNLPTESKLEAIGRAYVDAGESQMAFADISAILGEKATPKLLDMLVRLGTDGFGALRKAAEDAGNVMDKSLAIALDKSEDRLTAFKNRLIILAGEAIGGLEIMGRYFAGQSVEQIGDAMFGKGDRNAVRKQAIDELKNEGKLFTDVGGMYGQQKVDEAAIEQRITDIITKRAEAQKDTVKTAEERADAYEREAKAAEISAASTKVASIIREGQEAAKLKELSFAEKITQLEKDRADAMLRAINLTGEGSAEDMIKAAKEVAAIDVDIATIRKKDRDDQEKADEKRGKFKEREREEVREQGFIRNNIEEASRVRPTIAGLASGDVRGSSEAKSLAKRFQKMEEQERNARATGDEDFAESIRKRRLELGKKLQKYGINMSEIDPGAQYKEALKDSEDKLEAIRDAITKL